jgi:hypothetical protein
MGHGSSWVVDLLAMMRLSQARRRAMMVGMVLFGGLVVVDDVDLIAVGACREQDLVDGLVDWWID